jgi:membrane protease YdiL (CAAX protease family)
MIDALSLLASLAMLLAMSAGFGAMFVGVLRRFVADYSDILVVGRTPPAAISLVGLWLLFSLINRLVAAKEGPMELSLSGIQLSCLISLFIAGLLATALTKGGRRSAANQGLSVRPLARRIQLGTAAYLAAIGPTALLLVASSLWRTTETQHSYLKALRDDAGTQLLCWIVFSAVVAAPITEELLFRVTLQGWLSERSSAPAAIGLTACLFALVHGWRDALPLVPLSLVLGGMFYYSRSYVSCVVTHGLFNGTNIALALLTSPASDV